MTSNLSSTPLKCIYVSLFHRNYLNIIIVDPLSPGPVPVVVVPVILFFHTGTGTVDLNVLEWIMKIKIMIRR